MKPKKLNQTTPTEWQVAMHDVERVRRKFLRLKTNSCFYPRLRQLDQKIMVRRRPKCKFQNNTKKVNWMENDRDNLIGDFRGPLGDVYFSFQDKKNHSHNPQWHRWIDNNLSWQRFTMSTIFLNRKNNEICAKISMILRQIWNSIYQGAWFLLLHLRC